MAEIKKGDVFVSKFGTNLRLTITGVTKKEISCVAERKIINRDGEVLIEKRDRTVPREDWRFVTAGYVPSRQA